MDFFLVHTYETGRKSFNNSWDNRKSVNRPAGNSSNFSELATTSHGFQSIM